jgi:3-deoxy-D-manno-octulosonic-acid transferase
VIQSLALAAYSVVMRAAQPLLRRKLARRGVAEPGYLHAVEERFGAYTHATGEGYVWVHAVSLGEARAAAILIAKLRELMPAMRLLLTHGTATGRSEGEKILREGDVQVWQPWDTPDAVQKFLKHFKPRIGVLMETEVWPNLVAQSKAMGVPLLLVNARLNQQSLAKARRLLLLSRAAYSGLTAVYAQTEDDAQRLRSLGAKVQGVQGNLKFDAAPNAEQLARGRAWRRSCTRPVLMLASAREGEEAMLLDELLKQKVPVAGELTAQAAMNSIAVNASTPVQWLIVPRHPQRFDEVAALIESRGLSVSRRSSWSDAPVSADVWLGDSLGEMNLYYGLSDAALLGGSFAPLGGQNLIEALACNCPVIMGPHTFNFAEAAEGAQQAGAALRVADMRQAVTRASDMLAADESAQMHQAAAQFIAQSQGAAQRCAQSIAQTMLNAPA